MSVTVRRATSDDARTIAEFAIRLFDQHRAYDARRFAEIASIEGAAKFYASQTNAKDAAVLVAEFEGKIVGFAYLQFEPINYADLLENAVWLHDLFVDKNARRRNAGKLLIEESKKIAKEFGADKLMLSVAAKNEIAQMFFERVGFKTTMVEMMLDLTENEENND